MQKSTTLAVALAAGAATLSLALAQPSTQSPSQPGNSPSSRPSQPGQQSGQQGRQTGMQQTQGQQNVDRDWVEDAIKHKLFEIEFAQHVAQTAQDTQVRQFAETMADECRQSSERLRQAAQQLGFNAPTSMDEWQTSKLREIRTLEPSELDRKYIFHEAGAHKTAEYNYQFVSSKAQSDQLKQLAQQELPKIRQHMQQADTIARKLAGGSGMGAGGSDRSGSGNSGSSGSGSGGSGTGGSGTGIGGSGGGGGQPPRSPR